MKLRISPNLLKAILAIAIVFSIGNGKSFSDTFLPGEQISGLWKGTVTINDSKVSDVLGLLDQYDNFSIILDGDGLLDGYLRVLTSGDIDRNFSFLSWFGYTGRLVDTFGYDQGSMIPRSSITATLSNGNPFIEQNISLNLTFDQSYYRSSSFALISDSWVYKLGTYILNITIDSNGNLQGSDTYGCSYSGNLSILNANYNLYRVDIDIHSCYPSTVSTRGLATLTDTYEKNDTLIYAVTGYVAPLARHAFTEQLTRKNVIPPPEQQPLQYLPFLPLLLD